MATDQYSAFDDEGNDPYEQLRKTLSPSARMKMSDPTQGGGGGGLDSAAPGWDAGGYGRMPTPTIYDRAKGPNAGYPGGEPPAGSETGHNTSSIQGYLGGTAANDFGSQNALINKTSGITDFLSGSPTESPLYKALLNNARSSIGNSYDAAVSNTRANAESRGFGYEQPIEQGAEEGVRAQEAGALSAAPSAALEETIAPELQAAQLLTSQAGQYGSQGTSALGDVTALQESRNSKSASMFSSLMQLISSMMSSSSSAYGHSQGV